MQGRYDGVTRKSTAEYVIAEGDFLIAVQVRTGNKKYFIWIVKSIVFFIMKEISSKIYRDDMTE